MKNLDSVLLIFVGNKSDMFDEWEVFVSEVKVLVEEWGCLYFEIFVKNNSNVDEVFIEIVRWMKMI